MAIDLTGINVKVSAIHKDGNGTNYSENVGYWRISSSDTKTSMAEAWDSVGRGIANLTNDTYNDTKGTVEFSANELLG